MDIITSQKLRFALPLFNALAVSLLILSIGGILYLGREIFVPFALAILLSFSLTPVVNAMLWAHVPKGLAIVGAVLTALIAIGALGYVILNQLSALAVELPNYQTTMQRKIESLASTTGAERGPIGGLMAMLNEMQEDLSNIGEAKSGAAAAAAAAGPVGSDARPQVVTIQTESNPFATLTSYVSPLLHPLATLGVVLIFTMFILAQREDLRNRFIRLAGTDDLQQTTAAIDDAARRLGKLLLTQLAVNTCFGIVIAVGLYAIGVPSPFLWGILAGILRFVPYVGAVIGAALPLALGFAVDPGWSMVIWTAVLFVAVEPILGHVIEPMLYGHSSGLSPLAVILAAAIWTLIWGPVGLILATPLTICLVVMGRYVQRLQVIDVMLGDRPALSPQQIFYQRMLGGATRDAASQARDFLKERALATYYDEIALEGLRLAHEDVARFAVEGERLETLRRTTLGLVESLESIESPVPKGGQLRPEAAAAVDAVGPDTAFARIVRSRSELAPEWRGKTPVVCLAGGNPLDLPIAAMLGQVLTKHGLNAHVTTVKEIAANPPDAEDAEGVALVCLCFVEPLSTVHLRHLARQVHRIAPRAKVLIGIWRQRDPAIVAVLKQRLRVAGVVTTLNEAMATIYAMSGEAKLERIAPSTAPQRPLIAQGA